MFVFLVISVLVSCFCGLQAEEKADISDYCFWLFAAELSASLNFCFHSVSNEVFQAASKLTVMKAFSISWLQHISQRN